GRRPNSIRLTRCPREEPPAVFPKKNPQEPPAWRFGVHGLAVRAGFATVRFPAIVPFPGDLQAFYKSSPRDEAAPTRCGGSTSSVLPAGPEYAAPARSVPLRPEGGSGRSEI